ncbi:sigma-70 family RNA polymerase sigma factor [Aeromicrobium sp. Leaf350]|uniref:sigma-70 family RNA polymerase sigma factor n=1 Tax=Aeromicrobium sp. Leaf350 TaxID=2876565 RepID=UPI001E4EF506|nr:sigma-70 family RNA polymerase sigma factor [Aeromicrobium sp. Leaf350]
MSVSDTEAREQVGDVDLIAAVRAGDTVAYGVLFERHRAAAERLARQLVSGLGADDLVSDAFLKVLGVLQRGGGPDEAFRAYLLTSVRRLHIDGLRSSQRERTTDDEQTLDRPVEFIDPAAMEFERGAAGEAFRSLPERWQLVLWHLDVEGQNPADVAPLLGMAPNSVSALAYRAREGLRRAYLQQHLAPTLDAECRDTTTKLGAHVRHGLAARDTRKVEEHLDTCARCTGLYLELRDVNSSLGAVLGPILLGSAATGYLGAATTAGTAGVLGAGTAAGLALSTKTILVETVRVASAPARIAVGTSMVSSAPAAVATVALASAATVGVVTTTAAVTSPSTTAVLSPIQEPPLDPLDDGIRIPAPVPTVTMPEPSPSPTPSPEPTATQEPEPTAEPETPAEPEPTADPEPEPTETTEPPPPPPVVGTDFALGVAGAVNDRPAFQRTLTVPITGTTTGGVPADREVFVRVDFTRPTLFRSVGAGWTCSATPERWTTTLTCTTTVPAGENTSLQLTVAGVRPSGTLTLTADEDPDTSNDTTTFVSPSFLLLF